MVVGCVMGADEDVVAGDEVAVRLTPSVRAKLDAMRETDRFEAAQGTRLAGLNVVSGPTVTAGIIQLRATQEEMLRRAYDMGLRVEFDPVKFSPVEQVGDTWRMTAEQTARIVRPEEIRDGR